MTKNIRKKKSVTDILAMKQINNKWVDIANQLGVDTETFKKDLREDLRKIHGAFPGCRVHKQHWGPGSANPGFLG